MGKKMKKEEAEIKESLDIAWRIFYIREIDIARWLVDVYGIFALAIFISTYLLSSLFPRFAFLE